jgi:hypothetical protein
MSQGSEAAPSAKSTNILPSEPPDGEFPLLDRLLQITPFVFCVSSFVFSSRYFFHFSCFVYYTSIIIFEGIHCYRYLTNFGLGRIDNPRKPRPDALRLWLNPSFHRLLVAVAFLLLGIRVEAHCARYALAAWLPLAVVMRDLTGDADIAKAVFYLQNVFLYEAALALGDLIIPFQLAWQAFSQRSLTQGLGLVFYLVVNVLYYETGRTMQRWVREQVVFYSKAAAGKIWQFAQEQFVVAWPVIQQWYPWATMRQVECPMCGELNKGIISWLKEKHGILLFTLKSVVRITQGEIQEERGEREKPRGWVCWDFGGSQVILTRYAIDSTWGDSWFVEASLDGNRWIEIDRQRRRLRSGEGLPQPAYGVSKLVESRFIRITDAETHGIAEVPVDSIEFFGTVFE